ncbi:hypothetical protein AB1Y20_012291 [Prymnesium parvum]|uniref:Uncharacterized protein n=1 Tax=Prymnesium parvum TaxID=97485 RepID=A0AB34IQ71_PRYPA
MSTTGLSLRLRGGGCVLSARHADKEEKPPPPLPLPIIPCGGGGSALGLALLQALRDKKEQPPMPIRTHAERLPSGERGVSLEFLRALRTFYTELGAIDKQMEDVCMEKGSSSSACALTRSTGLSLAESVVLEAERRGQSALPLVGHTTTFFSYSWKGTRLGDMLAAIERKVESLEREDGRTRYVFIDIFCASQNLLTGAFHSPHVTKEADPRGYAERHEDIGGVMDGAMAAADEMLFYCSPLTEAWEAPRDPFLLPERGEPPEQWTRRGPCAVTRAWCVFEMARAIAKQYTLHVVERHEGGVGAITASVCEALRTWLADEGRAALAWLPEKKRGTSLLIANLGRLLQAQGRLDEAGALFHEDLEACRATLGNRHPSTLISINSLGGLLQDQGQLDEAGALYREALEARRETLGDRHPDTLASINNLGRLLQAQGRLKEAEVLYRETLEARHETLGNRHPSTLTSINNLGGLLQAQGRLEEAGSLFREDLEVSRETLGNRHPSTLASINNLGGLLQAQGRLQEAEVLYREALEAYRETLGNNHPSTLTSINNLGVLLKAQGRLEEAELLYREALTVHRKALGNRHPSTLTSINNLGMLLKAQGRLDEAEALFRETLEARRVTLGKCHPSTLTSINTLGLLLQAQGRLEEAEALIREALEARRETLGNSHPSTLTSMSNLGMLLQAKGQLDEAEALFRKALQTYRETLGNCHPSTLASINNLGKLLQAQGRLDDAGVLFSELPVFCASCVFALGRAAVRSLGTSWCPSQRCNASTLFLVGACLVVLRAVLSPACVLHVASLVSRLVGCSCASSSFVRSPFHIADTSTLPSFHRHSFGSPLHSAPSSASFVRVVGFARALSPRPRLVAAFAALSFSFSCVFSLAVRNAPCAVCCLLTVLSFSCC